MKTFFYFFRSFFFLFACPISALVIEAPNLAVIENEIEQLDCDALVVFDVDYTLIVPQDLILGPCGENYLQELMSRDRLFQLHGEEVESKVLLQCQVSLVDEKVLHLLEKLKLKGIRTIALTAINTGKFGLISSMEAWRVAQLDSLGIHFGWAFPSLDSFIFDQFKGKRSLPVYKQGVLASARYPKGEVLLEFLKHVQWKPSKVIFIDDRLDFIASVESELEREQVPHVSFYYTAAFDQACRLDEQLADFQLEYLIEKGEWLSDQEAKEVLNIK